MFFLKKKLNLTNILNSKYLNVFSLTFDTLEKSSKSSLEKQFCLFSALNVQLSCQNINEIIVLTLIYDKCTR